MRHRLRSRFWLETGCALASAFLCVLTLLWKDWIEKVFGFDPDHHNGSAEWILVVVLAVVAVTVGEAARGEWRRAVASSP